MGNRWTPRKALFRRFKQIKGHLADVFRYVEEIKQPHKGREEEQDLVAFLTVVQNNVVELDMFIDVAHHRFKTGKFPEIDDGDTPASVSDAGEGDSVQGTPRPVAAGDTTGEGTPDPVPNDGDPPRSP